jgi:hypothetical protein
MRARKNPQPFTLENLVREMKPGRVYSPEAIALKFGISADMARARLLGAVMQGALREAARYRGFRGGFWVPEREVSFAGRRVGALVAGGVLTGYTAELWRLHDLCMASRGQPELMRYPTIFRTARRGATTLQQMGEFQWDRAEHASDQQPQHAAQRQIEAASGRRLQLAMEECIAF